ncbi:MAG: HemK/PrmC family methyltransferase [Synechococcus sp. ELA057]
MAAAKIAKGAEQLSGHELLGWRRRLLASEGRRPADPADLDWLLDLAGGLGGAERQALWLHPERPVQLQCSLTAIADLWRQYRASDQPLQYLLGRCPWRDLELTVGPGVLIPRQETELLVDLALQLLPAAQPGARLHWADLGTGSGALAIALARALPDSTGLAVEASEPALAIAACNLTRWVAGSLVPAATGLQPAHARAAQVSPTPPLQLLQGDWWQPLKPWWGRLQLVVSNPPYIPSAVCDGLDPVVRDHEPRQALDGGGDGLDSIRAIAAGAPLAMAPGGLLLLEHHHDQSGSVLELLRDSGFGDVQAHRDLEGVERFASGRWRVSP